MLYIKKVNVGVCDDSSICFGYTGPCGDTMELFLKVDSNTIRDAKFQAIGCEGAWISGSAVTKMIKGKTLEQAESIDEEQVANYLGGIPEEKFDCIYLAVRTLRKTIKEFRKNIGQP